MDSTAAVYVFKRTEKKYILSGARKEALLSRIGDALESDLYGRSTVCSIYLDTPDRRLIRASLDGGIYKEKLRLRSYGTPRSDSAVFLEIKKKFDGIVYKRREVMRLCDAERYIEKGIPPLRSQIMSELDYAMRWYGMPKPSMLIAYERDAFYCHSDPGVRITFDCDIRYREDDLFPEHGSRGKPILPQGQILMEIKTDGAMPLFLSHALDAFEIYPTSFSKYGTAHILSLSAKGGRAVRPTEEEYAPHWTQRKEMKENVSNF